MLRPYYRYLTEPRLLNRRIRKLISLFSNKIHLCKDFPALNLKIAASIFDRPLEQKRIVKKPQKMSELSSDEEIDHLLQDEVQNQNTERSFFRNSALENDNIKSLKSSSKLHIHRAD